MEIIKKEIDNELDRQIGFSYSPYSGCKVACALQFANGDIVGGCNVENASYPLGLCAERNAITSAISMGKDMSRMVSLYIKTNKESFFTPCGACLQVISEFVVDDLNIFVINNKNEIKTYKFSELMPVCFDKSKLD